MTEQLTFPITEASQVSDARRQASSMASRYGLTETEIGRVALVVTEAATNVVKHATTGYLLVRPLQNAHHVGVEILALDQGPGIANISECFRDGYSTAGSAGTGLGAITRLATFCDIYSTPGKGTALLAQVWAGDRGRRFEGKKPTAEGQSFCEIGVVCVAKPGEDICGDAWAVVYHSGSYLIFVADGLGHGLGAAEAAREAVRVFQERPVLAPTEVLEGMHAALRHTRGAAGAVAAIDPIRQTVRFAGVGNIAGEVHTPMGSRKMVSHNGTLGHAVRKIQEFTYPWATGALMVLHSDGLATRWALDAYPGLATRHPSLIAGVLYRDFHRERDDVTVVVIKES